ncbi:MAG: hypothetical protein DRR11_17620, partial [Gammaproteobacteria bacterium]
KSNDGDMDGLSDNEEVRKYLTHPGTPDTDNDEIPDAWEIDKALNANRNDAFEDPDEDGLVNLREFQLGTEPFVADTDGDNLLDGADNCPLAKNLRQQDFDSDGQGNVCDGWYMVGLVAVGDVNNNGSQDLAALWTVAADGGQRVHRLQISDGRTGQQLRLLDVLDAAQSPLELNVMPDERSRGGQLVVISAERIIDGWPSVTVIDVASGRVIRQINSLDAASRLLAMRPLPESQLALLIEDLHTDSLEIRVFDVGSGALQQTVATMVDRVPGWTRFGLELLDSGGEQALAVFAVGESSTPAFVRILRRSDGVVLSNIQPETADDVALEMHAVPDVTNDGVDEYAVRIRNRMNGAEEIRVIALSSGQVLSTIPISGQAVAFASIAPSANSVAAVVPQEIYQFSVIDLQGQSAIVVPVAVDGELIVKVYDLMTGHLLFEMPFSGYPLSYRNFFSMLETDDRADGDTLAAVLEDTDTGSHVIEVRELQTGRLISNGAVSTSQSSGGSMIGWYMLLLLVISMLVKVRRVSRWGKDAGN